MAFRLFEGQDHAAVYNKFRPGPPDSCINQVIEYLKEKYTGDLNLAVDLGCGNGQCTCKISKYFAKVLGTDVSKAQIEQARKSSVANKNIEYEVAPAEKLPVQDNSAQLVIASTAAHWFDLPSVYEEGRRVLVPGGVMAFLCVDPLSCHYVFLPDPSKNVELNKALKEVEDVLSKYFAAPAITVFNRYKDIEIPYNDFRREYDFINEIPSSLNSIVGLRRSYSGFVTYCEANGETAGEKLLTDLMHKLMTVTGISEEDANKELFINKEHYFAVMARI